MSNLTLFESAQVLAGYTQKQRQILDAAISVFAEKGYAGASTHEIAKRAGVAEGNIFARFGSKRGLLNAVIKPIINQIFPNAMAEMIQNQLNLPFPSLADFCWELVTGRLHLLRDNTAVVKVFVTELFSQEQIRELIIQRFSDDYWVQLTKTLDQLKAHGQLVQWDNHAIMKCLWSIVGGTAVGALYFGQPLDDQSIALTVEAAIKALTP